jgi:hypothetical protein
MHLDIWTKIKRALSIKRLKRSRNNQHLEIGIKEVSESKQAINTGKEHAKIVEQLHILRNV